MSLYDHATFARAWEAFLAWEDGTSPPVITFHAGSLSIDEVCTKLWMCTAMMPGDLARAIADRAPFGRPLGNRTYAGGARVLRALYRERLPVRAERAAEGPRGEAPGERP